MEVKMKKKQNTTNSIVSITLRLKNCSFPLSERILKTLFTEVWLLTNSWLVWKYLIMPDRIHLLCRSSLVSTVSIKNWIELWKAQIKINWPDNLTAFDGTKADFLNWKIYVRKISNKKWGDFLKLPVEEGLVESHCDWPFHGEIYPFAAKPDMRMFKKQVV
jgi:hypothetical protein